jgi:hypothetical protein
MKPESGEKSESSNALTLVIKRARVRVSSGVKTGMCNSSTYCYCPMSDPTKGGAGACGGGVSTPGQV